jgi:ketosteroid isomerase-like protein
LEKYMKKRMLKALFHVSTIASICILGGLSSSAIAATSGDIARDVQEVQNLMSRRAFYHSVGQNENELKLWAKKTPIRWAQNQGCWIGMDALRDYYETTNYAMQRANLAKKAKNNPVIENNFEKNRQVGEAVYHLLTTPIIEIAKDGKTAKGMWYTPGVILTGDGKKSEGMDMWERYGVDFIKEDGQWRFLHIAVYTDFAKPFGAPLTPQSESTATVGTEGAAQGPGPGGETIKVPGPTISKKMYEEFSQTRVPKLEPRLPEPYTTLSKTFEYADCSAK